MALPSKIKMGDKTVEVTYHDHIGRHTGGYAVSGDYHRGKMRLRNGMDRARKRDVTVHELLHNIWEQTHLSDHYSQRTEEFIIMEMAGWIVQMMRDNPELVDYLMED